MKDEFELARVLLRKADRDLASAETLRGAGLLDTASFHLHQAAEKYLKAFLEAHSIAYPFVHDLEELLDLCLEATSDFELFRDWLRPFDTYAVRMRYLDLRQPSDDEVETGVTVVRDLRLGLLGLLPASVQPAGGEP